MVRYYRDWVPDPDHELPPDQAQRLPRYARGLLREDGSIERLELYESGTLSRVDYHEGGSDQDIAAKHQALYPNVTRMVHRQRGGVGEYQWSWVEGTDITGHTSVRATVLLDGSRRELMSIVRDDDGNTVHIDKYYWRDRETLGYAFEYDGTGKLPSIHDLAQGEQASFDALKDELEDATFYADGFALPGSIAGTPIPGP